MSRLGRAQPVPPIAISAALLAADASIAGVVGPFVLNNTTVPTVKIDTTITGVIGTLTLGASSPAPQVSVSQTVGALTLSGVAPTPKIDLSHTVGLLTLGASAPVLSIAVAPTAGVVTLNNTTTPTLTYSGAVTATAGVLTLGAAAHTVDTGGTPVVTDVPYFLYYPSAMRHR